MVANLPDVAALHLFRAQGAHCHQVRAGYSKRQETAAEQSLQGWAAGGRVCFCGDWFRDFRGAACCMPTSPGARCHRQQVWRGSCAHTRKEKKLGQRASRFLRVLLPALIRLLSEVSWWRSCAGLSECRCLFCVLLLTSMIAPDSGARCAGGGNAGAVGAGPQVLSGRVARRGMRGEGTQWWGSAGMGAVLAGCSCGLLRDALQCAHPCFVRRMPRAGCRLQNVV